MKILAVDDEPIVLGVLVKSLRDAQEESEIRAFGSSNEALENLRNTGFYPDVAFLDTEIYDMSGLELARQIQLFSPVTGIIFVTEFAQYALDAFALHARGYMLKPITAAKVREELDALFAPVANPVSSEALYVQCFGNFEVFFKGTPLRFERRKTKEVFAYLIDRRGATVTTGELCAVLWEDRSNEDSQRNQLRVLLSDLSRTLAAVDAADVMIKKRNSFAVAADRLNCDLYSFLSHGPTISNAYLGEYMTQYSWAELTLGALEQSAQAIQLLKP